MLPLRILVLPFEALSLLERARSLVLARDAADLAVRLLGPTGDRASGVLVWQRLVIEEALLRQVVGAEEAVVLMRRAVLDDGQDPRLETFLSTWTAAPRPTEPATRALTLVDGAAPGRARPAAVRRSSHGGW